MSHKKFLSVENRARLKYKFPLMLSVIFVLFLIKKTFKKKADSIIIAQQKYKKLSKEVDRVKAKLRQIQSKTQDKANTKVNTKAKNIGKEVKYIHDKILEISNYLPKEIRLDKFEFVKNKNLILSFGAKKTENLSAFFRTILSKERNKKIKVNFLESSTEKNYSNILVQIDLADNKKEDFD